MAIYPAIGVYYRPDFQGRLVALLILDQEGTPHWARASVAPLIEQGGLVAELDALEAHVAPFFIGEEESHSYGGDRLNSLPNLGRLHFGRAVRLEVELAGGEIQGAVRSLLAGEITYVYAEEIPHHSYHGFPLAAGGLRRDTTSRQLQLAILMIDHGAVIDEVEAHRAREEQQAAEDDEIIDPT